MLKNLQLILFFIDLSIKDLKKIIINYFNIYYNMVYYIFIVLDVLNKMCHTIEFWIIKS